MSPLIHSKRGGWEPPDVLSEGSVVARRFVNQTDTAAFSCSWDGTVMTWNTGAERVLRLGAKQAVNRKCYELFSGRDAFGNDFCAPHCAIRQMALRGRAIRPFQMSARDSYGRCIPLRIMVLVLRSGSRKPELVHLLDPLTPSAADRSAGS
jgi:hypothetical protein